MGVCGLSGEFRVFVRLCWLINHRMLERWLGWTEMGSQAKDRSKTLLLINHQLLHRMKQKHLHKTAGKDLVLLV